MNEFIEAFGKTNFIIIVSAIVIILFALFLILILEKLQGKRKTNIDFLDELENADDFYDGDIVYEKEFTKEDAKEKINDAAKKLVEKPEVIEHTNFEDEQEEESIISYDELVKNSDKIDQSNNKLLEEEKDLPITLDELLNKKEEVSKKLNDLIEEKETLKKKKIVPEVPNLFDEDDSKFKNSDVISPVFGVYKEKFDKVDDKYKKESEELEALEIEIRKTEDFLLELKAMKNKLD